MIEQPPESRFVWTSAAWGRALQAAVFASLPHVFTTHDLVLRGAGAERGWDQLARAIGVMPDRLVRPKQVHGVEVIAIRAGAAVSFVVHSDEERLPADIVMTDDPSVAVAVQVADCVPLLLADPSSGAVAAVHGGWRGTAAGVTRVAVRAMTAHFGTNPCDLLAALGPSIGACCYQVGADVADAFRASGFREDEMQAWFRRDNAVDRYRLDVPRATVDQLKAAGVKTSNISACGLCTACHPSLFPSYRRDGAGTGRIAGAIRPAHWHRDTERRRS